MVEIPKASFETTLSIFLADYELPMLFQDRVELLHERIAGDYRIFIQRGDKNVVRIVKRKSCLRNDDCEIVEEYEYELCGDNVRVCRDTYMVVNGEIVR